MSSHEEAANDPATPEEEEKAAAVESYGGVPMDDQELADVWSSGGTVESGAADPGSGDAGVESEGEGGDFQEQRGPAEAKDAEPEGDPAIDAPAAEEPTD